MAGDEETGGRRGHDGEKTDCDDRQTGATLLHSWCDLESGRLAETEEMLKELDVS
jgi:hypothetical protein